METLFGAEMPIAAKVLLALLIVLGLAGAVFYVVRYASPGRFVSSALRGRQPRLAVIEVAGVDQRRRLVLIRRDNVEHLLMIGGPSDVVVEPNILRAVAVGNSREAPQTRAEPSRAMAADGGLWPHQPEVAARRAAPSTHDDASWPQQSQSEPPARATPDQRPDPRPDPLAGLAAELGRASAPPEPITPPRESVAPPRDSAPRDVKRAPPPAAASAQASPSDQNLTEMAQRLEAALRQSPSRSAEPPPARPAPELPSVARLSGPPPLNGAGGAEAPRAPVTELRAPPRAEQKPPAPPKAVYDNLEQEMASLLGRPAGKV
jgi:flagellar biogenesis protein FliO